MTEQQLILDLLTWVKEAELWPDSFSSNDRFVVPVANTITTYDRMLPHQKKMALWLPSREKLNRILRERGLRDLELSEQEGVHFAHLHTITGPLSGIGVGPTEALLSLLHHLRRTSPVLVC